MSERSKKTKNTYQEYIAFFEEVYKTMQDNYYQDIPREAFEHFLGKFRTKIYAQLQETGKSIDYIRWRSAALMVEDLKSPEDIFSGFYPPKPAKEYEETALGKRVDLGIEGKLLDEGYRISFVEPRSDAYIQGLRELDVIRAVDHQSVIGMEESRVNELLNPLENTKVVLSCLDIRTNEEKDIEVVSKEYFKQTVFNIPMKAPNIYGLEIRRFNRKTADDVLRFLNYFKQQGPVKGLVIDLRNNPGGPPLAARELASFFLPGGGQFAYFQKNHKPKSLLDIPRIPAQYHYDGPLLILVNEKSGSASELFSGVLQKRGRAALMGRSTAGQVFLKSMFHFADDSMVLLVTARGHHPDGSVFSFEGLTPNEQILDEQWDNMLDFAAYYLLRVAPHT